MTPARALPAIALAAVLAASGCVSTAPPGSSSAPASRVATNPQADLGPAAEESRRLRVYYSRVQQSLVSQGLLRTDFTAPDAPYTSDRLAEDFKRIALYEEFTNVGGAIVARPTPSQIHRWDRTVNVRLEFGGAIPDAQQARDRRSVEDYVSRLAAVTGHPIRMVEDGANFHVLIVDEVARRQLAPRLRLIIPTISDAAIDTVVNLNRSNYCLVIAYDPEDDGSYASAVAIIRAEHPDLLRLSCIHEEIAQGLGLSNDFPGARPSIFNDDEEFALLTEHDEMLLRILYDDRLRPGMDSRRAMPMVRQIARELKDGPS